MEYRFFITHATQAAGWAVGAAAACVLIRALFVAGLQGPWWRGQQWLPGSPLAPDRGGAPSALATPRAIASRAVRELGWGLALIVVSAVYLTVFGSYFLTDQAGRGNLFSATTNAGADGWTLVTMLGVTLLTALAPRRAGYVAAVGTGGLGLYLLYVCAFLPPGVYDEEWYGWIRDGLDVQELAVAGTAALALSFVLVRRTIVADVRARETALSARVDRLTETRAEAVDSAAAELRRLERDLHDGAQARLVALGINLRTVEKLIEKSPHEAVSLVAECRDSATLALSELRALVRGIYPPVLADRGLGDAVRALALDCPVPAGTDIQLAGRLPTPVESAVYFAVAEALSNAAKHAQATSVLVRVAFARGLLRAEVHDNGIGGADPRNGTGLAGMERRLGAFDGILAVSSPPGGPTIIAIEVPCVLSSPKTSIS
ncbi:MAG TPA: histidine kinase [Trebonia sp.]|nr:histidine kinase [Trebonia sp.]